MLLNKTKCYKKTFFGLQPFLTKKQPKLTKNRENRQNPNCSIKFTEIWYVDTLQQIKILQKKQFFVFSLFWPFFNQKTAKIDQIWIKLVKYKPFYEISEIRYVDASQQQQKCYKKLFLDFDLFWPFFNQKTSKIYQKWRKLAKSKPFDEIFWNLECRCFPTNKNAIKNFFWIPAFFGRFSTKKQPKNSQKIICQNPNRLMKFSEIWKVDASQQKKCYKKTFLDSGIF